MDSFTQLTFGACAGYAVAGSRLGRRALVFGAIAGTIPDLDTVFLSGADAWAEWRNHRGVTHSLFFAPVVAPVLGWIAWSGYSRARPFEPAGAHDALGAWIALFFFALVTHPLLDLFTIYGTQLLAPFSDARFALPGLGIIDPIYTLPLVAAAAWALARPRDTHARIFMYLALFLSVAYQFYGVAQNQRVAAMARTQLAAEGVELADVRAYTTIFQPWLRRIVVDEPEGARVGFASSLQAGAISWTCFAKPSSDPAVEVLRATPEGRLFGWFAAGEIWASVAPGADGSKTVRLTDRRYGAPGPTVQGWWGIEAQIAADGRIATPPRRIDLPRGNLVPLIGEVIAASTGTPNELFPQAASATAAAEACTRDRAG